MLALYRFFKSVRLAIALLLLLILLSLLATLVPQGRQPAFYFHNYPPLLARLIVGLGYSSFFKSWLFLVPCLLFFVNLAVCTMDRLVGRWKRKARRRHGPDLVHVGLLVLIVGALFTAAGRREGTFFLGRGDGIDLPMGYSLRLLDYSYQQYEDGRPKDWISTVEARRGESLLEASYPIEVNRPLRLPGLKIYQSSFKREDTALLRDQNGQLEALQAGRHFQWEGSILFFSGIDSGQAVFERWEGNTFVEELRRGASQPIGPYTIVELSSRDLTGLKAVKDPGFAPVLAALALVTAGLALSFIQKRKDEKES